MTQTDVDGNASLVTPCDYSDATRQSLNLLDFFYKAAAYVVPGCLGIKILSYYLES